MNSLAALDGKTIGYLEDAVFIEKIEDKLPNSNSLEYASYAELIQALKTGRIDS